MQEGPQTVSRPRRIRRVVLASGLTLLLAAVLYLLAWPVPIDPVAWEPPHDPGYTGSFAVNERLRPIEMLSLAGSHGPEDVSLDEQGRIYAAVQEGRIVRFDAEGRNPQTFAETGGRPLGIDFDANGNLIVADAMRGLLSIAQTGAVTPLATVADGVPIRYADDVDVAENGKIYFSDASTKFGAKDWSGTLEGSLLDLMEHGGHGRLLVFDPATRQATTVLAGINFANGVAVAHDQSFIAVNETGSYRVLRVWLTGPKAGRHDVLIDALPGFPDNISTGRNGRFWIALVSPRSRQLDSLAGRPFLRKVTQRLPAALRPQARHYGHVLAIDGTGRVIADLQDPSGAHPMNTSAVETEQWLYLGSLVAPAVGRVSTAKLDLP